MFLLVSPGISSQKHAVIQGNNQNSQIKAKEARGRASNMVRTV